jgi:hypothetical protein
MSPGYDTVWIGKWHLSATGTGKTGECPSGVTGDQTAGPTAYGFNDTSYNIPNTNANDYFTAPQIPLNYPSPDGTLANEGCGGGLLQPQGTLQQTFGTTFVWQDYGPAESDPEVTSPTYLGLSDGAIADAFVQYWLVHAGQFVSPRKPWFCAVSFINPHDMSGFPCGYNLSGVESTTLGYFGSPTAAVPGYVPPPTPGFAQTPPSDETIETLSTLYPPNGYPGSAQPAGPNGESWNYPDSPGSSSLQYGPTAVGTTWTYGKPGLQYAYQINSEQQLGSVGNLNAWYTFLNYYYWIQSNVDAQVGRITSALSTSPFANNTIVIFLSDHGDYAGSHSLHGKGLALYDETINVPLYIQFPSYYPNGQTQLVLPYVCSSVDILPFIYTAALGNSSWRTDTAGLVSYLWNREAIYDFVFSSTPKQRRISQIQNQNGAAAGSDYQPYILHTTDEGFTGYENPGTGDAVPGHAIAFRTVDISVAAPYGGGKLGIYSYWSYAGGNPTQPAGTGLTNQQFEYYNYSAQSQTGQPSQPLSPNYGETGNSLSVNATAPADPTLLTEAPLAYQNNFLSSGVQAELYFSGLGMPVAGGTYNGPVPNYLSNAYTQALTNYLTYYQAMQPPASSTDTVWQT